LAASQQSQASDKTAAVTYARFWRRSTSSCQLSASPPAVC
jgi:hypothetical protein